MIATERPARRPLRRAPLVALLAAGLLLLAACTPEQQMAHDHINNNRVNAGAANLWPHGELIAKAQAWAQNLASRGVLEHSQLTDGVPAGWQMLAENVGRGPSEIAVLEQFLVSPSHRANMLNPDFTHAGTGVATGADGLVYVVEVFARY